MARAAASRTACRDDMCRDDCARSWRRVRGQELSTSRGDQGQGTLERYDDRGRADGDRQREVGPAAGRLLRRDRFQEEETACLPRPPRGKRKTDKVPSPESKVQSRGLTPPTPPCKKIRLAPREVLVTGAAVEERVRALPELDDAAVRVVAENTGGDVVRADGGRRQFAHPLGERVALPDAAPAPTARRVGAASATTARGETGGPRGRRGGAAGSTGAAGSGAARRFGAAGFGATGGAGGTTDTVGAVSGGVAGSTGVGAGAAGTSGTAGSEATGAGSHGVGDRAAGAGA